MAEVFIGSTMGAEGFSRKVAIKRVLPGYSDNPGFAQMFVSEAQISSQLVHPNIVSVLDFDRDEEARLFLVMELVDGKDLDTLLASGMLPLPVVIFVIGEVLRGLGFAHDLPIGAGMRGIVHRDVSPHNVLLSWEGAVKVSDFGIAKARAASEATASVFIKGKPAYMSPEQANGQRLDGRSDLFAVGVMVWEMIVGRRLFVAEDTRATLAAVLFGQIPRPRTIRPDLPKDLERVVMKLLERDLPARYATAEDAIADLMNCADAPRGGREALMAVLVERFPAEAPVRQSRARSMGAHPTPVPGTVPGYAPQTVTAHPSAGAASGVGAFGGGSAGSGMAVGHMSPAASSRPGLGTMMSAQTGTLRLPRRRWLSITLAVGAVAVAAVLAFIAVSASRKSGTTGAHDGSDVGSAAAGSGSALARGSGSALAATGSAGSGSAVAVVPVDAGVGSGAQGSGAQVASDVPHDASPAEATPTGVSVDAGVVPAHVPPNNDNGHPPKKPPPPHVDNDKHTGELFVPGFPVVSITVDGKSYGDSPQRIRLSAGKHKVRVTNPANGIDQTYNTTITENKSTTLER